MTELIKYGQIAKEDINRGTGTFSAILADDKEVILNQVLLPEFAIDTGTSSVYAVTIGSLPALYPGVIIYFKALNANGGSCQLNVNGLGAVSIHKNLNAALTQGDILAGQIVTVVYDGVYFQLTSLAAGMAYLAANNLFTGGNTFSGTSLFSNTAIVGALIVTGSTTQVGNITLTGAETITGTLGVSGNTTVGGTLGVTGASTLTGTVSMGDSFSCGGSMTAGTVPLARLKRDEQIAAATGVALTNSATQITTLSFASVNAGDRILIVAFYSGTKGGTAGNNLITLSQSAGSATVTFVDNQSQVYTAAHFVASAQATLTLTTVVLVSGSGSLTLNFTGTSIGSDTTVTGNIYGLVLNNG